MTETTTGLRRALGSPALYSALQNLLGARSVREHVLREHLLARPGERVLDLGCGPGDSAALLSEVDYVGVDRNPAYIQAARRRGYPRAEFLCADVRSLLLEPGSFDAVLAIGLLHHLDDRDAARVAGLAAAALADDGRLVTVDPARAPGQPKTARFLIRRDRGRNVRAPEALTRLVATHFAEVEVDCRHDLARIPYTHAVLSCRRPRAAGAAEGPG